MMRWRDRAKGWIVRAILPAFLVGLPPAASGEGFQKRFSLEARKLEIANLVGEIRVVGGAGDRFEIEASVGGKDAGEARVRFDESGGGTARFTVQYLLGETGRIVYPAMGAGSKTTLRFRSGNKEWLQRVLPELRADSFGLAGNGSGPELWVDLTVKVPAGAELELRHGAGRISISETSGSLLLDSHSGAIDLAGARGDLSIDTGSGSVTVASAKGSLLIDTGSGSVSISSFQGDVIRVDTGSGSVEARGIEARAVSIDTGSGSVVVEAASIEKLSIDTGSGSVRARLGHLGSGPVSIDTGAGGIDLRLPETCSAELQAETGSGGIEIDHPTARVVARSHGEIAAILGEGKARIELDTGSGAIRVGL